jgi:hypothetical protein
MDAQMRGKQVKREPFCCRPQSSHSRPSAGDIVAGVVVFHLIMPPLAMAYLDPISGSIILQVLAAGFLAAAATFRRSRQWLSDLFSRLTRKVQ